MELNSTVNTLCKKSALSFGLALLATLFPVFAMAQSSPWSTGSAGLNDETLAFLTPVAVIAVMVVGALCLFGKIHWGWLLGCVGGIVLIFGSQQIVDWIRGLFGV